MNERHLAASDHTNGAAPRIRLSCWMLKPEILNVDLVSVVDHLSGLGMLARDR